MKAILEIEIDCTDNETEGLKLLGELVDYASQNGFKFKARISEVENERP